MAIGHEISLAQYAPLAYSQIVKAVPMTLVEMPEFIERAEDLLSENQRDDLLTHIASNPECGAIIPDTGGVRKLRWAAGRRGKSGGVRVIYYFYNDTMPIVLLTVYAKSRKRDLSQEEKNELRKLMPLLVKTYQRRRGGRK